MSSEEKGKVYDRTAITGGRLTIGDTTFVQHENGASSIVEHHDGYDDVIHYGSDGQGATHHIVPVFKVSDTDVLTIVGGIFGLALLIFAVFGLFAVRNSTYSMMAAPYIVYQLFLGEGIGWPLLALFCGITLVCVIISHFTEQAGIVIATVWSLLAGVVLMIVDANVYGNSTFIYNFATENLIEYIGLLISTEVHVFFFMMLIQMILMLFSLDITKILFHWIAIPSTYILLNILSWVFTLFGSDYPTSESRLYSMIQPLCDAWGLSRSDMSGFLTWGAANYGLFATISGILTGVAIVAVVIYVIYAIVSD